jgi:hypothetical protein
MNLSLISFLLLRGKLRRLELLQQITAEIKSRRPIRFTIMLLDLGLINTALNLDSIRLHLKSMQ